MWRVGRVRCKRRLQLFLLSGTKIKRRLLIAMLPQLTVMKLLKLLLATNPYFITEADESFISAASGTDLIFYQYTKLPY